MLHRTFDAGTWAQFFLEYVISHPAITSVRVGTTKPAHMLDDIGGDIGRLPNEAMRKRMADFFDALPPVSAPQRCSPAGNTGSRHHASRRRAGTLRGRVQVEALCKTH